MDNWDAIVTDRRLTLELTTRHLERSAAEGKPAFLLDDYVALATGGSSGHRAVVVWKAERFVESMTSAMAQDVWAAQGRRGGRNVRASVMASSPLHASAIVFWLTTSDLGSLHVLPPALPLERIVSGLNDAQPTTLASYPSMLGLLAAEAAAGRLRIRPESIHCGGEPLLPEVRRAAESAFGVQVVNAYGISEVGAVARSNPPLGGLHLSEQIAVYEPVDRQLKPVTPGVRAASLLVTNVLNDALPLIRYQVTDEVTFLDEPNPGPLPGRRIADIEGRIDDVFTYPGGPAVHPHVIRSILAQAPAVVEYQVRQTDTGIDVRLRTSGQIDRPALAARLAGALRKLGLEHAQATIALVDRIERHHQSGKLKRFVPLASGRDVGSPSRLDAPSTGPAAEAEVTRAFDPPAGGLGNARPVGLLLA
jgi:phenylacetate-coenzyme A ligase PaaK-like adenylate-forming protein